MGTLRHHAIVVTSWNVDRLLIAQHKAKELCPHLVSDIVPAIANGGGSFFVAPDGSKEGWKESDEGDRRRDDLISWLGMQRNEDRSTWLSWAEVVYSNDDRDAKVLRHPWSSVKATGGT